VQHFHYQIKIAVSIKRAALSLSGEDCCGVLHFHYQVKIAVAIKPAALHYQVKIAVAFRLPLYHFQVKITVACQRLSLSFSGKDCCCYQACSTFIIR
jgi:hypothetical protein